jgi:hypothetical protein
MSFVVLVISLAHLALMNLLAFRKASFGTRLEIAGAFFLLIWCLQTEALAYQVTALFFLVLVLEFLELKKPFIFLAASLVVVAAIFGSIAWEAKSNQLALVQQFPMESMAERVPPVKSGGPGLQIAVNEKWHFLEQQLARETENSSRSDRLRKLHEDATEIFIESPGFGFSRMPRRRMHETPDEIDRGLEPAKSIAQPETGGPMALSTEDLERPYGGAKMNSLQGLHFGGLADFVNVKGFGYVKDREHVAGFRSHQFSKRPDGDEPPRVKRLELVSLLMHDDPVVYVSKDLPRMSELKKAVTRTLSDFEAKGLGELQSGEDLFVRETPDSILMLGAIRSVKQCTKCHGGERGDLLGAFSYSLTP